jgi:hypothetical protein
MRKGALAGLLLLAAAAAVPAGASAQIAPGYSGSSGTSYVTGQEAWRSLAAFGRCYARSNGAQALAFIATEPGSREEAETFKSMFRKENQSCLGLDEMAMPVTFVRGAIAEGLLHAGVAVPPGISLIAPAPGERSRTLTGAALCFVSAQPGEVRALLSETAPGSRKESKAFAAMLPGFRKCVVAEAAGRPFNATQIRFRLAEAMLRLARPEGAR